MRMSTTHPTLTYTSSSSNMDVDTSFDDQEEDSFMEGFSFESSQPPVDVVSWQPSQPSKDLWELAQKVPDRRNFKRKPEPTLIWDDLNDASAGSSSSTIGSGSGSFSRSTSHPSLASSSGSGPSSLKPDENTAPPRKFFAPVEATTVKLRRAVTNQQLPHFPSSRVAPRTQGDGRHVSMPVQKQGAGVGTVKGKEREREIARNQPRRSDPVIQKRASGTSLGASAAAHSRTGSSLQNNAKSTFSRSLSSSSSSTASSSHKSPATTYSSVEGYTPDTSMSMEVDIDPMVFQRAAAPVTIHEAKRQPEVRLHPLLLQKAASASSASSTVTKKPISPVIPSPTQSHFSSTKLPPMSQSSSTRRPVLGMCRRTHTLPSSQTGASSGGVKKFRSPLLSQVPPSQNLSRSQAPPPAARGGYGTKVVKKSRSPSPKLQPEVLMEADSSFGDMSFDMDALEETMKQYD